MDTPNPQPTGQPASERAAETPPRSFGLLFWLIAAGAGFFSLLFGLAGLFIVPAFEQVFAAFGASLPWGTALVLASRSWWWLPTAVVAALWCYSLWAPRRLHYRSQLMIAFASLCIGANAAIALAIVALYSPIFTLGSAAQ
ncbi:MAG TPA: hypothetical protein VF798_15210 [Burkholderiaceae bacterium]